MHPHSNTNQQAVTARFALGQIVITPGAEEALQIAGQTAIQFLRRHMSGDWGELSEDDVKENELPAIRFLGLWSITLPARCSSRHRRRLLLPGRFRHPK